MNITPKRKVLIIPSWYMTHQQPVVGSFFQEQAQLLSENFDIKVLFGQAKEVSKIDFYIAKVKLKLKKAKVVLSPHFTEAPEAWTFFYPQNKALSEERNTFMMFQYYWEAFQLLTKSWQVDLIHAHCVRHAGMISYYIHQLTSIPYLITEHAGGTFWLENFNPFKNEQMGLAYQNASFVVSVSHSKMREILSMRYQCNAIVIGNYINETMFTLSPVKHEASDFQLLIVANEPINKDLKTLFNALNHLAQQGINDIHLTVVGISPDREQYTKELCCLFPVVSSMITFVDTVNRQDIASYFQQCDLFVSTSINESFGLSVAEAIMCGKPVVVTRSGGIDDVVDSSNGIKVHIRDWKSLAEAILKIKNREIVFDAEAMRKSMIEKFGSNAFLNKMTEVYLSTIKN